MFRAEHRWSSALIAGQLALVAGAFGALVAVPPAEGRMMLVPIGAQDRATLPARAVAGGALLIGSGPVAGSLIVQAKRAHLDLPGILILAAPASGCGEGISA